MRTLLIATLVFLGGTLLAEDAWKLEVSRMGGKVEGVRWVHPSMGTKSALSLTLLEVARKDAAALRASGTHFSHASLSVAEGISTRFPDGGIALLLPGETVDSLIFPQAPQKVALHADGVFFTYYDAPSESVVLATYSIADKKATVLKRDINPIHLSGGKVQITFKSDSAEITEGESVTRFQASGTKGRTVGKVNPVSDATKRYLQEIKAEDLVQESKRGNLVVGDWMQDQAEAIERRLLAEEGTKRLSMIVGKGTQSALINLIADRIATGKAKGLADWSVHRISATQFGPDGLVGGETAKVNERFDRLSGQKLILVIENAHLLTLVGGDEATVDKRITSAMAPFLTSGKVLVLATTSTEGLTRLQGDPDFLTPFETVTLEEPNAAEIMKIVANRVEGFTPEALSTLVDLSARHLPEEGHPIVELEGIEALARERAKSGESEVSSDAVRKWMASRARRASLSGDALRKFATPEEFYPAMKEIIGATRALDSLRSLISQMAEEDRETGVPDRKHQGLKIVLFTGPSGTGKTFIVKELEKALSNRGIKWPLNIVNGNEYASESSDWKLLGPPAGYKDSEKKYLYHWTKENPEGLLFFDEFDKQHPKVAKAMMNVLDEGVVPLGLNNSSFRWRGIIFLAANFGSMGLDQDPQASPEERDLADLVDQFTLYYTPDYTFQKPNMTKVRKYFVGQEGKVWPKPTDAKEKDALIGRLGDVLKTEYAKYGRVLSNALLRRIGTVEVLVHWTKAEFTQLIDNNLKSRSAKLAKEANVELEFTPALREWLIDTCWGQGGRLAFTQGAGAFVDAPAWNRSVKDVLATFAKDASNHGKKWVLDVQDGKTAVMLAEKGAK